MQTIEALESEVRSYCRQFPAMFTEATASTIRDENGNVYLDFFSGAGSLNYGHNHPRLKKRLLEYIERDGITHGLDMATAAKRDFLARFQAVILEPRGLDYKVQFPGPTGTNAIEAALKLARKATGRETIVSFFHAFHGMTLGSLAISGNLAKRTGAGIPLTHALSIPFEQDLEPGTDTLTYLRAYLENKANSEELPAAIVLETVQAEGGVRAASRRWIERVDQLAKQFGVLLIVDDIQVGCGRTGTFFSFESMEIRPDMVCLSKSISGYGLPMALVLIRPELDIWEPGEHNGTFRGNNLAFITGDEALTFWEDDRFRRAIERKAGKLRGALSSLTSRYPQALGSVVGRGLIQGIRFEVDGLAKAVSREAFKNGLIIETAGPQSEVLKLLPPLIIEDAELEDGVGRIEESLRAALIKSEIREPVALA